MASGSRGFRPVPGTGGNRYFVPDGWTGPVTESPYKGRDLGRTVTRRQIRNVGARSVGFSSYAQYDRLQAKLYTHDPAYRKFVDVYRREKGRDPGPTTEVLQDYLKIRKYFVFDGATRAERKKQRDRIRRSREYRNPKGPVAQFLAKIGLRQDDWRVPVGDSPKAGK